MKFNHYITVLFFIIFSTNIYSQNSETFTYGDWKVFEGDNGIYLYCYNPVGVENTPSNLPDLTIRILKEGEGPMRMRLDNAYLYRYQKDKNYVDVDFIIDDGDIISYDGQIIEINNDNKTRVVFERNNDSPTLGNLFSEMKKGNNIFIRTTGSGDPMVFKFSLDGFTKGYNKMFEMWSNFTENREDNPFKKKANPFKR